MLNKLENLKELLVQGFITQDEFDKISKRFNEPNSIEDCTWEDIVEGFYKWTSGKYTLTTRNGYKTCLLKFIKYYTKINNNSGALAEPFKMYGFKDVKKYIDFLNNDFLTNQTISKNKYAVIVLGTYLETLGLIVPVIENIDISISKEANRATPVFHEDEIYEVANCGNLRDKLIISLCYEAALKRAELTNLKMGDFNLRTHQLILKNEEGELDRVHIMSKPLTRLVSKYIGELREDIDRWNKSRLKTGKPLREYSDYLFQNVKNTIPSYNIIQCAMKNNSKEYYSKKYDEETLKQKVSNFTVENIRNSRKVKLLSEGYTVTQVMTMLKESNYMSVCKFKKLVPLIYPESVNNEVKINTSEDD